MDIQYTELAFEEYSSDVINELYSIEDIKSCLSNAWSEFEELFGDEDNDYEDSVSSFLEWYEDDTTVLDELITADKRYLIQKYVETNDGCIIILEVKPIIIYMKEK